MANEGRLQKSFRNMVSGAVFRGVSILVAFLVRTVFIKCLDSAYLGVNGLYSSILNMLSLAELGFSTAVVYSMYKPLADKDYEKLRQIMRLYQRVYAVIGTVILLAGLSLVPFLDYLIKNKPDLPYLTFYYLLFLGNSVISYWFFAYRSSLLHADQKAYITSNYHSIFNLIKAALQIAVLLVFHNFTIYLLSQLLCTALLNITIAIRVKMDYPVFDKCANAELPAVEKQQIFKNVRALMIQKVSFKVLNSSDSIIISTFIGVNWVGLLSNYIMVEEAISAVLTQVFSAISASMGNFFAKESKEKSYVLFQRLYFLNFWLYGFSFIALVTLLNPLIELWFGKNYILQQTVIIALCVRFLVEGYMNLMSSVRSAMGLFTQGKYIPLVVAALNVILSIGLSYPFGMAGVLFATPLSRCIINVWYTPLVIHRDGFGKTVKKFYAITLQRITVLVCILILMQVMSAYVFATGITLIKFASMVCITAIIPNAVLLVIYCRSEEFKYFFTLGRTFLRRIIH